MKKQQKIIKKKSTTKGNYIIQQCPNDENIRQQIRFMKSIKNRLK